MLAVVLALVAALGFGSTAIFARVGMQGIRPLPSTVISTLISFVPTLLLALAFAWSDIRDLPPIAYLWLLCLGALSFLGVRAQNFAAINLLGASRSSPFVGTSVVFGVLFAVTITGERPQLLVILGTLGVLVGLVVAIGNLTGQRWLHDRRSLLGYALAMGAGASYGGSNVLTKVLISAYGSPLMISAFGLMFGVLLLLPLAGGGAVQDLKASGRSRGFLGHVVLAGLASAFAIIAFGYSLQRSDVVIVSPIVSINPLITLLLAQVFLPGLERVTKQVVAGTLLTVAGVVVVIVGSTM